MRTWVLQCIVWALLSGVTWEIHLVDQHLCYPTLGIPRHCLQSKRQAWLDCWHRRIPGWSHCPATWRVGPGHQDRTSQESPVLWQKVNSWVAGNIRLLRCPRRGNSVWKRQRAQVMLSIVRCPLSWISDPKLNQGETLVSCCLGTIKEAFRVSCPSVITGQRAQLWYWKVSQSSFESLLPCRITSLL